MSLDFFANTSNWTDELFGVKKPIIAMCHLLPLPSDPYYDEEGGMEKVIERARRVFGCPVYNVYGQSECGPRITAQTEECCH